MMIRVTSIVNTTDTYDEYTPLVALVKIHRICKKLIAISI